MPAAAHAASVQKVDADTLPQMRKAVVAAVYKGSAFRQVPLFFALLRPQKNVDPVKVWATKAIQALTIAGQQIGASRVQALWEERLPQGLAH